MKERTRLEQEAIAEAAERQMRRCLMMQEIEERLEHEEAGKLLADHFGPYITISREAGAGGGQIAISVAEKLGWEVFDSKLLDFMAQHYHLPRDILTLVDERTASWLHDTFGGWLDRHLVSQSEYLEHLGKIVLLAAYNGRAVFVGRGVHLLLPREKGFAVRVIAPLDYRIKETMRVRGLSQEQARKSVEETDRGRREFVRRHFHHDVADPGLYDLVINVARIGPQAASDLIVEAAGHCLCETRILEQT